MPLFELTCQLATLQPPPRDATAVRRSPSQSGANQPVLRHRHRDSADRRILGIGESGETHGHPSPKHSCLAIFNNHSLDFGSDIKCVLVISSEIDYHRDVHRRQHAPRQLALAR